MVPCIEDIPQQNHHDDHKNDLEDCRKGRGHRKIQRYKDTKTPTIESIKKRFDIGLSVIV